MENLWQNIKAHPWIAGAVVVAVFLLVYLLVGGGGSAAPAQTQDNSYAAEVAAATQLQEAQLSAQAQGNQANLALQAQQGQYQTAVTIAQIQAQENQDNNNAQTTIASKQIDAQLAAVQGQQASQNLQTTTNGQIASNYIAAQQAVATAGFNTQSHVADVSSTTATSIYGDLFASQLAQSELNAGVLSAANANEAAVATGAANIYLAPTTPGGNIQLINTTNPNIFAAQTLALQDQYGTAATQAALTLPTFNPATLQPTSGTPTGPFHINNVNLQNMGIV